MCMCGLVLHQRGFTFHNGMDWLKEREREMSPSFFFFLFFFSCLIKKAFCVLCHAPTGLSTSSHV